MWQLNLTILLNPRKAFQVVDKENLQNSSLSLGSYLNVASCQFAVFSGNITDINAWNKPLTDSELNEFASKCNQDLNSLPNLISWKNFTKTFSNERNITKFNVTREGYFHQLFCLVTFPWKARSFDKWKWFIHSMNFFISVPYFNVM